jgi:hypothetical protein
MLRSTISNERELHGRLPLRLIARKREFVFSLKPRFMRGFFRATCQACAHMLEA